MSRVSRSAGVLLLHAVLSARALMQRKGSGSSAGGLDTDDGLSPMYGLPATGSKEENATMWEETFEKVFTVKLNMSRAREAGIPLGVKVDVKSEFEPLSVQMIRSGLAQEWNDANPDMSILVGDQITAVNGHAWRQDTRVFAERIKTQFKAAKEGAQGPEEDFNMTIQRPRRQDVGLPLRLQDLHQGLYTKEFEAQMDIPGSKVEQTLADTLGWQLNVSVNYWMPVVIKEIRQQGLVAEWNEKNPESSILPGDEIIAVNDVAWQHNSYSFIEKVVKQFEASRSSEMEPKGSLKLALSVRRPKPLEAPAEMRLAKLRAAAEIEEANVKDVEVKELGAKAEVKEAKAVREEEAKELFNELEAKDDTNGGKKAEEKAKDAEEANEDVKEPESKDVVKEAKEVKEAEAQLVKVGKEGKVKEVAAFKTKNFLTALTIPKGVKEPQAKVFGWQLAYDGDDSAPVISKVRATGLVAKWNHAHPAQKILPGDKIVEVNNFQWQGNSKQFADRIAREFDTLSKNGRRPLRMYLKIQRQVAEDASKAGAAKKMESSQEAQGNESSKGSGQQAVADDAAGKTAGKDQKASDATASEPGAAAADPARGAQGAAGETAGKEQQGVAVEAADDGAAAEESSLEALGYGSSNGSEQAEATNASSNAGESTAADDGAAAEESSLEALGYESSNGSEQAEATNASSNAGESTAADDSAADETASSGQNVSDATTVDDSAADETASSGQSASDATTVDDSAADETASNGHNASDATTVDDSAADETAGKDHDASDATASKPSVADVKEAADALKSDNINDLESLIAKLQAKVKAAKGGDKDTWPVESERVEEPKGAAEEAAGKDVEESLGVDLVPEQTAAEEQAVKQEVPEDASDSPSATKEGEEKVAEPSENAANEAIQDQVASELEGAAAEAAEPAEGAAAEAAEQESAAAEAAEPKGAAEEAAEPAEGAAEEAAEPAEGAAEEAAEPKGAAEEAAEPAEGATEEAAEPKGAAEDAAEPAEGAAEEAAQPAEGAAEEAAEPEPSKQAVEPVEGAAEEGAEPEPAKGATEQEGAGSAQNAASAAEEATEDAAEQKALDAGEKTADAAVPQPVASEKKAEEAKKLRAIGDMFKELQDQIQSLKAKVDSNEAAEQTGGLRPRSETAKQVVGAFPLPEVPAINMAAAQGAEHADSSAEKTSSIEKKAEDLEKKAAEQSAAEWSWPQEQAGEQTAAEEKEVEEVEKEIEEKEVKDVEEALGVDLGPEQTTAEPQAIKQEGAVGERDERVTEVQDAGRGTEAGKDSLVAELRKQIGELQAKIVAGEKSPQEGAAGQQASDEKASEEEPTEGAERGPGRPQEAAGGLRLLLQKAAQGPLAEAADSGGAGAEGQSAAEEVATVVKALEQRDGAKVLGAAVQPSLVALASKKAAGLKAVEEAALKVKALEEKQRAAEMARSTEEDDDSGDEEETREVQEAIDRVDQLEGNLKTLMSKLASKVTGKKAVDQNAADQAAAEEATEKKVVDEDVQQPVVANEKAEDATVQSAADEYVQQPAVAEQEDATETTAAAEAPQQPAASEGKDEEATKQERGVETDAILGMLRDIQSEIQALKSNAAEQKAQDPKAAEPGAPAARGAAGAGEAEAARASRIAAKEAAEAEAAGEAEARVNAAIEAKAAARAAAAAAEAETAAAEAEAKAAAEAAAAARAETKSASDAEEFFRSEARAASGAEARSREEAAARVVAAARAEAKASALESQLEDLNRRWEQRMEESRQKGEEQLAQLREQHKVEVDSLQATHASDLTQLEQVKRTIAQRHGDEGAIRKDERLKAREELDELLQRQQEELKELQQEHGRVLSDAKRRSEMELADEQEQEQEQLARLLDGVKSSVLDVMRVVDEATADKSTQITSQDQKLEARERSLGEVEGRLMAESKAASEQQQKVFDLIEGFAERLNKSGVLDALDQKLHAREESATGMESIVSQETDDLGEERRDTEDVFSLARRMGEESLERSAREGGTEERHGSTQDAGQGLAGDISATNEQQLRITDMIGQLEDKARQGGQREKPSLRGTTTVALPREVERIAADFSVEEGAAADAPAEEERDPSGAPVENTVADAPVEEKDAVDTPVEKSGAADVPVEERDPADAPVEESDEANAPAEKSGAVEAPVDDERDPAGAPVEQSSAADAPAEESGPADAPAEQSGAPDAAAEEKDAADAPAEEKGPAEAPAEQSGAADAAAEEKDAADVLAAADAAAGAAADAAAGEKKDPAEEKDAAEELRFYASSANKLVEAWNMLHPEDPIPAADAMVRPGVAYRRRAEQKPLVPAKRIDLQRPYATPAAGEFLAKSSA